MLPEISRRCLGCGAAVRAHARFCPQCGRLMGDEAAAARQAEADGADGAADAPPSVAGKPKAGDSLRLDESWRRWEESVSGRMRVRVEEEPAKEDARDVGKVDAEQSPTPAPPPEPVAPREAVDSRPLKSEAAGTPAAGEASGPRARPQADAKGRRAAAVRETLRPRVEKVRDASVGVLEEAAEDSGLRFVIIAVFLFLLFLLLLLLNQVLR